MNRDHIVRMIEMAREAGRPIDSSDDEFDPDGPPTTAIPFGMPEAEITTAVDVTATSTPSAASMRRPRQPDHRHVSFFLQMPRRGVRERVRHRVVHPHGRPTRHDDHGWLLRMTRGFVPRPPRAGRRRLGHRPDPGPRRRRPRPGRGGGRRPGAARPAADRAPARCGAAARQRAARRRRGASSRVVEPRSPRSRRRRAWRWGSASSGCGSAMGGTWATSGARYVSWRVTASSAVCCAIDADTVVVSHFVAINAAIGAALGDDRVVVAASTTARSR